MVSLNATRKFPRTHVWQQYYATIIGIIFYPKKCILLRSNCHVTSIFIFFRSKFSMFDTGLRDRMAKPSLTATGITNIAHTFGAIEFRRSVMAWRDVVLGGVHWRDFLLLFRISSGTKTVGTFAEHSVHVRLAVDLFRQQRPLHHVCAVYWRLRWWRCRYSNFIHFGNRQRWVRILISHRKCTIDCLHFQNSWSSWNISDVFPSFRHVDSVRSWRLCPIPSTSVHLYCHSNCVWNHICTSTEHATILSPAGPISSKIQLTASNHIT